MRVRGNGTKGSRGLREIFPPSAVVKYAEYVRNLQ